MKVLHFSTLDGQTGAGVAAARIHNGLTERGIDSRFCVAYPSAGLQNAFTPPVTLIAGAAQAVRQRISTRLLAPHTRGYDYVLSTGLAGHDIRHIVAVEQPDVIHLHWINGDAFRLATLAGISVPIVWRLSDMWPFCGIAHLEPDSSKYMRPPEHDATWPLTSVGLPERVRRRKQLIYATLPSLTLAVPSRWLRAETSRSALLGNRPIELIPTSCDTRVFSPRDRRACREALGLPVDARIVLVGATSMATRWKGGDLFADAMLRLASGAKPSGLRLATFGKDPMDASAQAAGVAVDHFGPVRDRQLMAILYNAADVFVAPSRMENLANTVLESLACGTPVVAFDIGGMPDMIENEVNGGLAPPFDTGKLADGIAWALNQAGNDFVRQAARNKILSEFSLEQEIEKYMALYSKVLCARSSQLSRIGPLRAV